MSYTYIDEAEWFLQLPTRRQAIAHFTLTGTRLTHEQQEAVLNLQRLDADSVRIKPYRDHMIRTHLKDRS